MTACMIHTCGRLAEEGEVLCRQHRVYFKLACAFCDAKLRSKIAIKRGWCSPCHERIFGTKKVRKRKRSNSPRQRYEIDPDDPANRKLCAYCGEDMLRAPWHRPHEWERKRYCSAQCVRRANLERTKP